MKLTGTSALYAALAAAGLASAHMEMVDPPPFRSKHNPNAQNVDYSMTSPLGVYPCKGYLSDLGTSAGASVATWAAGSQQKMTISGGAAHGGGSCQVSLSYDQGATFKVIHSKIGDCPTNGESALAFTVPANAPGGEAVVAWTWFNQIGNREMYMNCAAVTIEGGSGGDLSSLPDIFVANVAAAGSCGTSEGSDVEFPNPGPSVENLSSKVAPPTGNCPASGGSGSGNPYNALLPSVSTPTSTKVAQAVATNPVAMPDIEPTPTAAIKSASTPPTMFITVPAANAVPSSLPGGVFLPNPSSTLSTVTRPASTASAPSAPATTSSSPSVTSSSPSTPSQSTSAGVQTPGTACSDEGAWNCIGGSQFQRCASGQWSVVMAMASGTSCSPGISATLWKRAIRGTNRFAV